MTRALAIELCALALTGAALIALAPVAPITSGIAAVVALIGPYLLRRYRTSARWSLAMLLVIALGGATTLLGVPTATAVAGAIAALLAVQRVGRSAPAHDRGLLPLAVLALALAGVVTPGALVAVLVVATAAVAPVLGVLTTTAEREGAQTRVVPRHLVPIAAAGATLCLLAFVTLPRPGSATLGLAADAERARIGFTDEIAIGEIGELLDDGAPALRLAIGGDLPRPTLLRGVALDTFDGRRWRSTEPTRPTPTVRPSNAVPVRVHQQADAGPVAFAPGPIAAVASKDARFEVDAAGTWRLLGPPRAIRYTAWVDPAPAPVPAAERPRWLTVPTLDRRIRALASEVVGAARRSDEAAQRVADWLSRETTHTLSPRDTSLDAPLETFLLTRRTGHCEHHATAAAILLRLQGFPTRVVHGYANPEFDGQLWRVRRGNAHAWIEVLDEDGRWLPFDVTPGGPRPPPPQAVIGAWTEQARALFEDRILTYDGLDQREAVVRAASAVGEQLPGRLSTPALGLALLILAAAAGAAALGLLAARLTRSLAGELPAGVEGPIARIHRRARQSVARAGYRVPPALPPAEAADWLAERDADAGSALGTLAWLHYRARYAGEPEAAMLAEAQSALRALRRRLRKRAGAGLD